MRGLLLCVLILLMAAPSIATQGGEGYPKVLTYSYGINLLPPATIDSLSWYDVLVCIDRPQTLETLRIHNPNQRYLWQVLPQHVDPLEEEDPWWLPDTLWSIRRLITVYAAENDWYLRDTNGEPIAHWNRYLINWTQHCPVGTFGSSKGLRAAEWIASVALPEIALSGRGWPTWHWDARNAYNGYMFEILADCLGSYGWEIYADADPDADGEAEGVYGNCSTDGGSEDPLSVLFREENEVFYDLLSSAFPDDFVFLINENHSYIGPWWTTKLSGMKLENWMRETAIPSWNDWWDWFYGKTPPWDPSENWGAGYAWIESEFDKPVDDHLAGWDLSFIQVREEDNLSEEENLRMMRWGLGTSMLGDGYFCYTYDQHYPLWQPEFDWDFGEPTEDFRAEIHSTDSLYVRFFEEGMVEVNPNAREINGVPMHDSRFSFWLTVDDLAASAIGDKTAAIRWTAPTGDHNQADGYELRYATFPLGVANWEAADSYIGNPVTAPPGTEVFRAVDDLISGETYYFGVRTRIEGRLEPYISNVVSLTMGLPTDTTPPEAIADLHLVDAATDWLDLGWTAVGDDGHVGLASSYALRYLVGEQITTEHDWDRAIAATDLPLPEPPGIPETYRLTDLQEGTTYGIAVRALDEAGNISPLHPPFSATTESAPPPPDTIPPAVIADLELVDAAIDRLDLRWTASGDDGYVGVATSYALRYLIDEEIASEGDWDRATEASGLPPPEAPGIPENYRLTDLQEGTTYGIAIRALDEAGNISLLPPPFSATTESTPPPPDTIPPAVIGDLHLTGAATDWLDLGWTATGDDGTEGIATSYALRYLPDEAIATEEDWDRALAADSLPQPAPPGTAEGYRLTDLEAGTTYGIAVRAIDEENNISALHFLFFAATEPPAPPDITPPAVIDDLRLSDAATDRLDLGWTATGDDGTEGIATSYALRYLVEEEIVTEDDWDRAVSANDLPEPAPSGTEEGYRLTDLEAGTTYGIAIRALDEEGNTSDLHTPFSATTAAPPPPDTIPPGIIDDLHLLDAGQDWVDLGWTATGDDDDTGIATSYALRYVAGDEIVTESDWDQATAAAGLPQPQPADSAESYRLTGLQAGTAYGIAIRALDEETNISTLHPPFSGSTASPPPPDTLPPAGIYNLAGESAGTGAILLTWSAPGDDGWTGRADRYEIRLLPDAVIENESDWSAADPAPIDPPAPAPPFAPETLEIGSLVAGASYGIAIRALDEADNLAPLSNPLVLQAGEEPPPPEDTVPPAAIEDLEVTFTGETSVVFVWTATGDDSTDGTAEIYECRLALGHAIDTEQAWEEAETPVGLDIPLPAPAGTPQAGTLSDLQPGQLYGIALRARDEADNLGSLGNPVTFVTLEEEVIDEIAPESIGDLRAAATDTTSILLRWSAPADSGPTGQAVLYHLRIAPDGTDDESVWEQGQAVEGLPPPSPPGTIDSVRVVALDPLTRYGFVLRSEDGAGNFSEDSNIVWAQTDSLPPPPPVPPAPIFDLRLVASGVDTARFRWTAPGEDGWFGRAVRYHIRLRTGGDISSEEEWQLAEMPDTTDLGRPASAGSTEEWTLRGLEPATTYALAIRAEDASGLLGDMSNPLNWTTLEPPPPSPPGPIVDLVCTALSDTSSDLSWSAPATGPDQEAAVGYRLVFREGIVPITTEEDWQSATERSEGLPEAGPPGTVQSHRLLGLAPETDYSIALRAVDYLDRLGELGDAVVVTTEAPADTSGEPVDDPPAAIADLEATATSPTWIDLAWTAVGEDNDVGSADHYELRLLEGEPFAGLDDWDRAQPCEQILPHPAHAGSRDTFRLLDLVPESSYGIALRAFDAAGQISPWANGIFVELPGETPDVPLPIQDFVVADVDTDGVTLSWSHPDDPGTVGGPDRFWVGLAIEPITEENWHLVAKHPDPPAPTAAGTQVTCRWEGLQAETVYWTAVQVESGSGVKSDLSEVLEFTTPPLDLAAPEPPSEVRIDRVDAEGTIHLAWDPSSSPDVAGYHLYGQNDAGTWSRLNETMIPPDVNAFAVEANRVAYALTAIDHAGNEGERSEPVELTAESFSLNGPFPHPVVESCRFTIDVPLAHASEPLRLRVYDLQGRTIRTIYDDSPGFAGVFEVTWDRSDGAGRKVAPGFYLVTLETATATIHRRVFVAP